MTPTHSRGLALSLLVSTGFLIGVSFPLGKLADHAGIGPAAWSFAISGGGEMVKGDYLSIATQIGADLTLRKPVDPEQLLQLLADMVKAPQHTRNT